MKTKTKKKLFSVTVENVVTDKDLENVLESAFGSCGVIHWTENIKIGNKKGGGKYLSEIIVRGGSVIITHDDGKLAILDLETIRKGIPFLCNHTGQTWIGFCENCDGPAADVFVQMCLFHEILYC